jgi:hypothetical protein
MSEFLSTSDGPNLTKAFMRIKNTKFRRRIVDLVEELADDRCALLQVPSSATECGAAY